MYHDVEDRKNVGGSACQWLSCPKDHLNHLPLSESFVMTLIDDTNPDLSKNITQLKINISIHCCNYLAILWLVDRVNVMGTFIQNHLSLWEIEIPLSARPCPRWLGGSKSKLHPCF